MYKFPDENRLRYEDKFEAAVMTANLIVYESMKDPGYAEILRQQKAEAMHDRGFSIGGTRKAKYNIPMDAYYKLPEKVMKDKKLQDAWIRKYHPYLIIDRWWTIPGETRGKI